ncbi:MAG: guanylate kinase, partial [Fidelibacterota bacterium]
ALHQRRAVVYADVDVKGALSIKNHYPDKTALVFIMPPSMDALLERLKNRGTDSEERIQIRLQRLHMEMSFKEQFDYVIINDKLEEAVTSLENIIIKETKGARNGN